MGTKEDLRRILTRIDGRGYKAYKEIEGAYDFGPYECLIDHVQADPFADPSRVRIRVPMSVAQFPPDTYANKSREVGLRDYLTRIVAGKIERYCRGSRGSGRSGLVLIDRPGQEILERTSCLVTRDFVEIRIRVGLPAAGRRILGSQAKAIFFEELPQVIEESLFFRNLNRQELYRHLRINEDQDDLREQLEQRGLVAFVPTGSILPRRSGVDDRPMKGPAVVPFESPPSLTVTLPLKNGGEITGMGIPQGVTLIVGGGYHGKSTLLNAIQRGVYNHIPGDGREFVVTHATAVKIRAEDGRRIERVNISAFIDHLPFNKDTTRFSTDDASGSTSQAANIMEALEVGARLLLIDEDTSATNFMIRDHRMQELVAKEKEPITPFIDKVRLLFRERGVSTILVMGGSGDYFDVADCVIMMEAYRPRDVTGEARRIAEKYKAERKPEGGEHFGEVTPRRVVPESLNPRRGKREIKVQVKGLHTILFGTTLIDLSACEQLVDVSQTRAIADALVYAKMRYLDGKQTLAEVVEQIERDIQKGGLDILSPRPMGHYAYFRRFELAAALNRLRTLRVA